MRFRIQQLFWLVTSAAFLVFLGVLEIREVREIDLSFELPLKISNPSARNVGVSFALSREPEPEFLPSGESDPFADVSSSGLPFSRSSSVPVQMDGEIADVTIPKTGYRSYLFGRDLGTHQPYDQIQILIEYENGNSSLTTRKLEHCEKKGHIVVRM